MYKVESVSYLAYTLLFLLQLLFKLDVSLFLNAACLNF